MDNSKTNVRKNPNEYDPKKQKDAFKEVLNELIEKSEDPKETKKGLADALDVSEEMIRQYTKGNGFPNTQKLLNIARYFNCSLDYLIGLEKKYKNPIASAQGACKYTGLSEEAIENLRFLQERYDIGSFIESPAFIDFIKHLRDAYEQVQFARYAFLHYREPQKDIPPIFHEYLEKGYNYFPESLRGTQWIFAQNASAFFDELTDLNKTIDEAEKIRRELSEIEWKEFENGIDKT